MTSERIARTVAALRAAGHAVDEVTGPDTLYRVDGGDAVTGPVLLATALRMGLPDAPEPGAAAAEPSPRE